MLSRLKQNHLKTNPPRCLKQVLQHKRLPQHPLKQQALLRLKLLPTA